MRRLPASARTSSARTESSSGRSRCLVSSPDEIRRRGRGQPRPSTARRRKPPSRRRSLPPRSRYARLRHPCSRCSRKCAGTDSQGPRFSSSVNHSYRSEPAQPDHSGSQTNCLPDDHFGPSRASNNDGDASRARRPKRVEGAAGESVTPRKRSAGRMDKAACLSRHGQPVVQIDGGLCLFHVHLDGPLAEQMERFRSGL